MEGKNSTKLANVAKRLAKSKELYECYAVEREAPVGVEFEER
jgi:hypothetical protein